MKNLENEVINKLYDKVSKKNLCTGMSEAHKTVDIMLDKWLSEEHGEDDVRFWVSKLEHEAFCAGAKVMWDFLAQKIEF